MPTVNYHSSLILKQRNDDGSASVLSKESFFLLLILVVKFLQIQEWFSSGFCRRIKFFVVLLFICLKNSMADLDRSSDDSSLAAEESSHDSKLEFSEDEETLITRMFNLVGERWTLIAGRIPGRTAEEIEKYWTSRYSASECKTPSHEFGFLQLRA